jgi:hypothetical protein
MHGVLKPAFTGEQEHQRVERDAQIEPERGVLHIPIVERAFFFVCYKVTAVDLRPTGNPGADHQALCAVGGLILRQERIGRNGKSFLLYKRRALHALDTRGAFYKCSDLTY